MTRAVAPRDRERIADGDAKHESLHHASDPGRHHETEHSSDKGHRQARGDGGSQDRRRGRSQRDSHAQLPAPFHDGLRHEAIDPERTEEQGYGRERREEERLDASDHHSVAAYVIKSPKLVERKLRIDFAERVLHRVDDRG